MERLAAIIDKAPSELSHEDLLIRLRLERDRVREALQTFRESTSPRQSKAKAKIDPLAAIAAQAGLTTSALRALIEAEKKGELG